MLFREALEELKDRFIRPALGVPCDSSKEQDVPMLEGRLDAERVRVLLTLAGAGRKRRSCLHLRPDRHERRVDATCGELGIAAEKTHIERFVSGLGGKPRPKAVVAEAAPPKASRP